MAEIQIVFDGPPSHESGRFVEVEDMDGKSIGVGRWVERPDGFWALCIPGVDVDKAHDAHLIAQEEAEEERQANSQFGVGA